ncbi:MAG: hypothetical protein EOP83_21525 [Verrucomicrobiaceae bacterium]|nr:MAG: hypothetical protein EOP83_21525 [Verrucomicrobiaceae bacterium]
MTATQTIGQGFVPQQTSAATQKPVQVLIQLLLATAAYPTSDQRVVTKRQVDNITNGDWRIRNLAVDMCAANHDVFYERITSGKNRGDLFIPSPERSLDRTEKSISKLHSSLERSYGVLKSIEPDLSLDQRPRARSLRSLVGAAAELVSGTTRDEAVQVESTRGASMGQFITDAVGRRKWR